MSNAAQFIFSMQKCSRFYPPDREVLRDINISFYPGAKIGVLGHNGAGKSSLLQIMAGKDDGFTGVARLSPGFSVGMLEQEPELDESKDVKGNVMDGVAEVAGLLTAYDACLAKYADPDADYEKIGDEQARLEAEIAAKGANDLDRKLEVAMDAHDRYFLDNVAGWILELDRGRGMPFQGNYSSWLEQKQARLAQEDKADSARGRTLQRELDWVRMAPKARQAKGKARLSAYEKLLAEAKEAEGRSRDLQIAIPSGDRLGDQVIEVDHLSKGYGDKLLIDDLSFSLPKAGIVGVIGGNGVGKTTLFRMLTDGEQPDSGSITTGTTVQLAYVDQSRQTLDPEKTVYEELTGGTDEMVVGGRTVNGRAYCAQFNFKGSDQQKKVGVLSGGERNRVHLAKVLSEGGNVLLLDEPTNDLDVDTLRALEDGLESFPGCAVVISHDRWFLDRIATHILAFEGDSQVRWFEGNFSEYESFRKKELGSAADQPHRIKYKPLAR